MNDQEWLNYALSKMHSGQWFGFKKDFTGSHRMSYENIIVHNSSITKPSESAVNAKIQELKGEGSKGYIAQRKAAYPEIGDQLDMLWHSIDESPELKQKYFKFYEAIKAVKAKYPK